MSGYPTALAPQLNQVPEDAVPGVQTPTHGGMIVGHEYDMPIGQTAQSNMQSQSSQYSQYQTHHHQQYRDQYSYRQQQQQEYLEFSIGQKENLEINLKQFLFNYLAKKQINEKPSVNMIDNISPQP